MTDVYFENILTILKTKEAEAKQLRSKLFDLEVNASNIITSAEHYNNLAGKEKIINLIAEFNKLL